MGRHPQPPNNEQPLSISQRKAVLHAPRKEIAYKRRQPKNRFEANCGRCLSPSALHIVSCRELQGPSVGHVNLYLLRCAAMHSTHTPPRALAGGTAGSRTIVIPCRAHLPPQAGPAVARRRHIRGSHGGGCCSRAETEGHGQQLHPVAKHSRMGSMGLLAGGGRRCGGGAGTTPPSSHQPPSQQHTSWPRASSAQ